MVKQLPTARRAAAALLCLLLSLLAISSIAADVVESDINNNGGTDENNNKQAEDTTANTSNGGIEAPSSLSPSSSSDTVHIANSRPVPPKLSSNNDDNIHNKSQQPTANTIPPLDDNSDSSSTSSSSRIVQSFSTLFTPQIEEYTVTKFDPYSFSGAPLGGWGRATRSRLASLPIRLVSDYGGGFELGRPSTEEFFGRGCELFGSMVIVVDNGSNGSGGEEEEEVCVLTKEGVKQMETIQEYFTVWGLTEEMFTEIWRSVPKEKVSNTNNNNHQNNNNEEETIGLSGFLQLFDKLDALYTNNGEVDDPWESNGPHFTVRDGSGQQFVCRAYDEGELEVDSCMNSMFQPGIRLGYSKVVFGDDDNEKMMKKEGDVGNAKQKNTRVEEEEEDNGDLMDVMTSNNIAIDTVILDGNGIVDGNVAEALTTEIRNLLEDLEFTGQLDGDNIVIDIDVEEMNNRDISDIVKAAIQGAGLNKDGGGGAAAKKKKNTKPSLTTPPTQLTTDQIFEALKKLRGVCSQLHLGWWSYEWCHDDQVRQFHVDVTPDPTATDGRNKYEIKDVTTIGYYQGITEIINPVGMYNGEMKKGWTATFIVGEDNEMIVKGTSNHGAKEDNEYSKPFYDREKDMKAVMTNRLKNEMQQYKMAQAKRLGNSGGIVKQQFSHGDMCDEVGVLREVSVEYRCCTDEEISHWLQSKRRPNDTKRDENPLAVLVSVQEDETCVYRAKVCTPVLCPASLSQPEVAPTSPTTPGTPATDGNQVETPLGKDEAVEAVRRALNDFSGEITDVKILMGGEETVEFMNELTQAAQNGEDLSRTAAFNKVIEAAGLGKQKIENSKLGMLTESIDGRSIREVLESTLGARPCIAKNLGW